MRTPDARFADLPGFPFQPRYLEWRGLRAHYLDEGSGKTTYLCLHGEPTWSYLYRRMIPPFAASGARVVAPDFIGFGRSDKPEDEATYTFAFHREYLLEVISRLDLRNVTLVVQDWGGLLGLTLPMEMPERFERLLVMNTTLGTGDVPLSEGFLAWRAYVAKNPDLACGKLLARTCPHLAPAEAAAYDAPFPDARAKAGARRFPQLVPDRPDAPGAALSRQARQWLQNSWKGESFMAVGAKDPVLGVPVMQQLRSWIRNCPEPLVVEGGGHFLQEWGEEVATWFLSQI
jgi:pimeloyl-ACP methyl ester carboxylesterase